MLQIYATINTDKSLINSDKSRNQLIKLSSRPYVKSQGWTIVAVCTQLSAGVYFDIFEQAIMY